MTEPHFPSYPPGFRRSIMVFPQEGQVSAGLEDDIHRFHVLLRHRDGVVTEAGTQEPRVPYTTCPAAGPFFQEQVVGRKLADILALDKLQHCTHLYDLAVIAAALAHESEPMRFDMFVADRIENRTTATLSLDGQERLCWQIDGNTVVEGGDWSGRELRGLNRHASDFSAFEMMEARMLQMATIISYARMFPAGETATDFGSGRTGTCFTHQPVRENIAVKASTGRIDFSETDSKPLADFDGKLSATQAQG